ncbi:unnamed protein product [Vicia faba]|uniref:Uncharacterized protein n=1 Tax=Vicia faba TaxID=3906 RepID=A0AAV0ZRQ5_VICFA|nr:unnamed protein product [Vicia faba]
MGVIYKNRGDLEAAITYYERCLTVSPNFEIAKNNMATALTDLGTKVYHHKSLPYEHILRKNEQMYAFLGIFLSLCPQSKLVDETVNSQLREKYGEKMIGIATRLNYFCPRFFPTQVFWSYPNQKDSKQVRGITLHEKFDFSNSAVCVANNHRDNLLFKQWDPGKISLFSY